MPMPWVNNRWISYGSHMGYFLRTDRDYKGMGIGTDGIPEISKERVLVSLIDIKKIDRIQWGGFRRNQIVETC